MELEFAIGTRVQSLHVPERCVQQILRAKPVQTELTGSEEVCRALAAPIGSARLREIVHPGERVAIITSDITRPMPT